MNQKITAILVACICYIPSLLFAQSACSISGMVQDSLGHPLDLTTVALHTLPDSTIAKTALTDFSGAFVLPGLKEGQYFIEVFAMDHKIYKSAAINLQAANPGIKLPAIVLYRTENNLKEVQVAAKKPLVVRKTDRTIVNVDAMISVAGATALDVLERSPGVQVDPNGAVSLRGKQGVTIYINDKPTYLSGADLANYLRSLPASSIDQLELMTNPPANYDAAGSAGIINIKLKRNLSKGFNGGLNLSVNQGQLTRSNNSLNINYRNNKVSGYANLSYGLMNGFSDLDLNRTYKNANNIPTTYFEQNSYFRNHANSANLITGVDYYQSDKTTIGIVLTGMERISSQNIDNTSNLFNAMRQPDSTIVAHNRDDAEFTNGSINLNYRRKFDNSGHGLTADADYLTYRSFTKQLYQNEVYMPQDIFQSADVLKGRLPGNIDIYSFKADYTRPGIYKWTLVTGIKTSYTQTDNKAEYRTIVNSVDSPDYNKSNHFLYRENINAAYVNISREIGRLSVQGGLRLENTMSYGHQLGNRIKPDSSFNRNYTNLFPTLYLNYKFDTLAKHVIGMNYGRRIDRPYYQDLNPFLYPMDKFTYYTGNPFLKPAFNQTVELSYSYKSKITAILTYSKSKDDVNETIRINDPIYYSMPGNIGSKATATFAIDADFDPAKWFNVHLYSELGNITSKSAFYTGTLYTSGNYGYISANLRFSPGKDWTVELNGYYRSKIYDAQFVINDLWQMNIAAQKKLSDKATLKMSFSDMFYSSIVHGYIGNLVQAEASWVNRHDSRNVSLAFSYRFGKTFNKQEKYDAKGADAEKNRVKN